MRATLLGADLETLTPKLVRKELERRFDCSLKEKKQFVSDTIPEILEELQREEVAEEERREAEDGAGSEPDADPPLSSSWANGAENADVRVTLPPRFAAFLGAEEMSFNEVRSDVIFVVDGCLSGNAVNTKHTALR